MPRNLFSKIALSSRKAQNYEECCTYTYETIGVYKVSMYIISLNLCINVVKLVTVNIDR